MNMEFCLDYTIVMIGHMLCIHEFEAQSVFTAKLLRKPSTARLEPIENHTYKALYSTAHYSTVWIQHDF